MSAQERRQLLSQLHLTGNEGYAVLAQLLASYEVQLRFYETNSSNIPHYFEERVLTLTEVEETVSFLNSACWFLRELIAAIPKPSVDQLDSSVFDSDF